MLRYVIGPTPIALLLVAVLVLVLREYANIENIISMWTVSVISFFAYYLINWGLYKIAGTAFGIGYAFSHAIWVILYSLAVITLHLRIHDKKGSEISQRQVF